VGEYLPMPVFPEQAGLKIATLLQSFTGHGVYVFAGGADFLQTCSKTGVADRKSASMNGGA